MKTKDRITFRVGGVAVLLSALYVAVNYVVYSSQLVRAGYDPTMLAVGGLMRAIWMTCFLGVPITFFLILEKIIRSLRKPRKVKTESNVNGRAELAHHVTEVNSN